MVRSVRFPFAAPLDRTRGAGLLAAAVLALGLALSAEAALAGSDYPPGLFENSPVVPHGYKPGDDAPATGGDAAPQGPAGPSADVQPPDANGPQPDAFPPQEPYGALPPPPAPIAPAPGYRAPPWANGPPPYDYDYCASIASRAFRSLEEVRRAHARCDRAYAAPPPAGYPPAY